MFAFNHEPELWCARLLSDSINHVSVAVETKPGEIVHLTWTGRRIGITAGAKPRDEFIAEVRDAGALVVEHPIRECWTPALPPYTCVTMVKHVVGLGARSLHVLTPRQLLRHLRGRNGRNG